MDVKTKSALRRAREHITEKDYVKAKKALKRIDHPTARKWEAMIDERMPNLSHRGWWYRWRLRLIVCLIVLLALIYAYARIEGKKAQDNARDAISSHTGICICTALPASPVGELVTILVI